MRLSCNGCRVLRKGCSGDCPIRPCLQWIKSPQSQANATLFLAKFYGRAGLINLINASAPHLRPAAFKSLLDEACGRIVNPIFGCSGLLSSGRWDLCEATVEAVLSGAPIEQQQQQQQQEVSNSSSGCMLKACDIRQVAKRKRKRKGKGKGGWVSDEWGSSSGVSEEEHRIRRRTSVGEADTCSDDEGELELDLNLSLGLKSHPARPRKSSVDLYPLW